jgi:hypothetical protein
LTVPEPAAPVVKVAVTFWESPGMRTPVSAVQLTEATDPVDVQDPEYLVSMSPVFLTLKTTWFPVVLATRMVGSDALAGMTLTPTVRRGAGWSEGPAPAASGCCTPLGSVTHAATVGRGAALAEL